jgi:hypothetical protein
VGVVPVVVEEGYLGLLEEGNYQKKEEDHLPPL